MTNSCIALLDSKCVSYHTNENHWAALLPDRDVPRRNIQVCLFFSLFMSYFAKLNDPSIKRIFRHGDTPQRKSSLLFTSSLSASVSTISVFRVSSIKYYDLIYQDIRQVFVDSECCFSCGAMKRSNRR